MEITEKVAYLKGLMEGMKIDTETYEGKILSAMVEILDDIGLELEDLWNAQGELEDGLDVVSDDLEDIEDIVYDEDDEESVLLICLFTQCVRPVVIDYQELLILAIIRHSFLRNNGVFPRNRKDSV